jgi:hypothetical protein
VKLLALFFVVLCLAGCFKQTRTMQENTQVNLKAQTWAGEVQVTGVIDRTQNEQTEVKVNLPPLPPIVSSIGTYLTGAGGVGGLLMALYATRQKRLKLEEAERTKERDLAAQLEKQNYYLRELCKGVSKYLSKASEEDAIALRACLKESLSKDTRDAIRDFI